MPLWIQKNQLIFGLIAEYFKYEGPDASATVSLIRSFSFKSVDGKFHNFIINEPNSENFDLYLKVILRYFAPLSSEFVETIAADKMPQKIRNF